MILPINDDHRIRGTSKEWVVEERYTAHKQGTGEPYDRWRNLGHFSDFKQAVRKLVDHQLKTVDAQTVQEVIEAAAVIASGLVGACERFYSAHSKGKVPEN